MNWELSCSFFPSHSWTLCLHVHCKANLKLKFDKWALWCHFSFLRRIHMILFSVATTSWMSCCELFGFNTVSWCTFPYFHLTVTLKPKLHTFLPDGRSTLLIMIFCLSSPPTYVNRGLSVQYALAHSVCWALISLALPARSAAQTFIHLLKIIKG